MSFDLNTAVALVTGANRGIGRAITERFLDAGVTKIYTAVRNPNSVRDLQNQYGARIVPIAYDLTRKETAVAAAALATDVNLVVSNAGVVKPAAPTDADMEEALKYQMDGNVYPLLHLAQAFGPVLKANGGGAFVQMNSLASLMNFAPITGYAASKAASYAVTQGLREAWIEQGTQVISVMAGAVKTDMSISAGMGEGAPPPSLVADGILTALETGDFFVYPDPVAQKISKVYTPFAEEVLHITH